MDKPSKCARFCKRKWMRFLRTSTCSSLHRSRFPPPRSRSIWKPAWHFLIRWAPLATFAGCRRSPFPVVSPKRIYRLDSSSWPARATTSSSFKPRERSSNTPIGTGGTRRSTRFNFFGETTGNGERRQPAKVANGAQRIRKCQAGFQIERERGGGNRLRWSDEHVEVLKNRIHFLLQNLAHFEGLSIVCCGILTSPQRDRK